MRLSLLEKYYMLGIRKLLDDGPRGTQKDLSNELGIDKSYCSQLVNGKRRITDEWKERLAAYFQMDPLAIIKMGEAIDRGVSYWPWIIEAKQKETQEEQRRYAFFQIAKQYMVNHAIDYEHLRVGEDKNLTLEEYADVLDKWMSGVVHSARGEVIQMISTN